MRGIAQMKDKKRGCWQYGLTALAVGIATQSLAVCPVSAAAPATQTLNIDAAKTNTDTADQKKMAQLIEPQTANTSRIDTQRVKEVSLKLDTTKYTEESQQLNGKTIKYRAYRKVAYVAHPAAAASESMSIFIPEAYFQQGTVNGYTAKTAPIFLPNGVGGYMPGNISEPSSQDRMSGGANASLVALSRGCVVAAPAVRGRTTTNAAGQYVGKAPALIVDYKAAVRYLRYNKDRLPAGDTEKIISDGTSAGGALSALLGATGNSRDYEPYLQAIGAANERDDIFGSMDYCPITNLDHADMAYEWVFNGVNDAHQRPQMMPPTGNEKNMLAMPAGQHMPSNIKVGDKVLPMGPGPVVQPQAGGTSKTDRPANAPQDNVAATPMTAAEIKVSADLKKQFPAYVNSLKLKDARGNKLTLEADGTGSFADYLKSVYMASAQSAVDAGEDISGMDWFTVKDGKVTAMDLAKYAAWATRMKAAPAFDKLDASSGENDEFGTMTNVPKHFTRYAQQHETKSAALADSQTIRLLNPMEYIGQKAVTTAPHWRIRHGAKDRDTSLAIPALLALKLQNSGYAVDFASPWGKGHAGDYDLDALFDWVDHICKN